jgi:hypothetical protein
MSYFEKPGLKLEVEDLSLPKEEPSADIEYLNDRFCEIDMLLDLEP